MPGSRPGLGATPVSRWLDCHVLRAPGGHLLRVVPVHGDPELFAQRARVWTTWAQAHKYRCLPTIFLGYRRVREYRRLS